jgi:hypothetical protein
MHTATNEYTPINNVKHSCCDFSFHHTEHDVTKHSTAGLFECRQVVMFTVVTILQTNTETEGFKCERDCVCMCGIGAGDTKQRQEKRLYVPRARVTHTCDCVPTKSNLSWMHATADTVPIKGVHALKRLALPCVMHSREVPRSR